MRRLLNCIREFTIGTIDDAGDDSFLCHIVSLPLLYECFVYVVVLYKGHSITRIYLQTLCSFYEKSLHMFLLDHVIASSVFDRGFTVRRSIFFLQFLTQCCNCWRRIQQVSCYNTNVDITFSAHDAFLE